MNHKHILRALLPVAAAGLFLASGAQAAITTTGEVSPDVSTWTSTTYPVIGNTTAGTLSITNGSQLTSGDFTIASSSGSNGTVSIDGAGSKWTINHTAGFQVGNNGAGLLSVTNGGSFVLNQLAASTSMVGVGNGSNGTITVDGSGSTINLGSNGLDLGYYGNGTLNITNGGSFTGGSSGYNILLGANVSNLPSTGTINVSGKNSILQGGTSMIAVGYTAGNGVLNITDGGTVVNNGVVIYVGDQAAGKAVVDGTGSNLTNTQNQGALIVGLYANGTLSVSDGGAATAKKITVYGSGQLTVDVGSHVYAKAGNGPGTITNDGVIRMVAGAGAASGIYTPITAGTWTYDTGKQGTYQALGGVWDSTAHTVTVNSAITTTAGTSATIDLYTNQRGLVTDPATGKSVGLGFQATTRSTPLTFTASAIGGSELSSLQSLLTGGKSVLSAWSFSTTGYTTGSPVYLSLAAGSSTSLADLVIWKYNGATWSALSPTDLAYDKTYASFTATDLSDYAVAGTATPTPIPAAVWLLGSGLMGLVGLKRKKMMA